MLPVVGAAATIWVPDDHGTIQGAIDNASSGDTIMVRPDTYVENIDFLGKAITVKSEQGAVVTIIDGNQNDSVVTFCPDLGMPPKIEGFTIRGGLAAQGGGIRCQHSNPTISLCFITQNTTLDGAQPGEKGGDGAGVYGCPSSYLILQDCAITNNTTGCGVDDQNGGGGAGGDGGGIFCDLAIIERCIIRANMTGAGGSGDVGGRGGHGAGIYCASAEITACTIDANKNGDGGGGETGKAGNGGSGGGIYFSSASPEPTISGCTITENSTGSGGQNMGNDGGDGGKGGGVYCLSATIANSVFKHNQTGSGMYDYGDGGDGGAICGSTLTIDSCSLVANSTGSGAMGWAGGGTGGSGGAIWCTTATINASIISDNLTGDGNGHDWGSDGGDGGGLFCASAVLDGCVLSRNATGNGGDAYFEGGRGGDGGGIYFSSSSLMPVLASCALCGNHTGNGGNTYEEDGGRGGNGAGIHCTSIELGSCTLSGNQTGTGGTGDPAGPGGIGGGVYGTTGTIVNSILWGNAPDELVGGSFTTTYCDVEGGWSGTGNIDTDPLFVDPANGDHHIPLDSPCRDAGYNLAPNLPEVDFEGDPRLTGYKVDIGADEFHTHLYTVGDVIPGSTIDVKVTGLPWFPATLALSSTRSAVPLETAHGTLYLELPPLWQGSIGTVTSRGVLTLPVTVPAGWSSGDVYHLQAVVGPWGGPWTQLTNCEDLAVE